MRKLLIPFSLLYSLSLRLRNLLYDLNIVKSKKGSLPTIVLGNLTVGGTGKTPMTIYIASLLKKKYKICILSRGYKRKNKDCIKLNKNLNAKQVGDEPKLIAQKTKLPVFLCANRLQGLNIIKQNMPQTQIVILDDGFQHRALKPDISILLIDCTRPVYNDFFLPTGNLRDNKYRLKHADTIIFTKCPNNLTQEAANRLIKKHKLKQNNIFFTSYKFANPYNIFNGQIIPLRHIKSYQILVISGIANWKHYLNSLKILNQNIKFIKFSDHHTYNQADIKKIFRTFAEIHSKDKIILTTEKDAVKLTDFDLPYEMQRALYAIPVEIDFLFDRKNIFNSKIYNYGRKLIDKD